MGLFSYFCSGEPLPSPLLFLQFYKMNIMLRYLSISLLLLISSFLSAQDVSHQWSRTNPGGGGNFSTVAAGPTGIVLAGSDLSGAYRSLDNGQSWDVIGASKGLTITHVSCVGFDPVDGDILYIGTEGGIFRSDNGGNSVVQVLNSGYITDIQFAHSNTAIGYASYHPAYDSNDGVVFKTTDHGLSWSLISTDIPTGRRILKLEVSRQDEDKLYLLSGEGGFACSPSEVYRSTDGGVHWSFVSGGYGEILDMAIDPANDDNLYMTSMDADCAYGDYWYSLSGGIYKSIDSGDTWTLQGNQTGVIWLKPSSPGTIRLIDPREPYPWADDEGTWQSTDDGVSWSQIGSVNNWGYGFNGQAYFSYGSSFNGICKTLGGSLQDEDVMFWVNTQWCFGTTDGGVTFTHLHTQEISPGWWQSTGFDNVDVMDIAISPVNNNKVYLGYFDMGFWRSFDGGGSWQSGNNEMYAASWIGLGGNVASIEVDPARENVVWCTMSENQDGEDPTYLIRSDDSGEKTSWVDSYTGLPTVEIIGLVVDPNSDSNNRTLYVTAEGNVYKSTNDGYNWSMVFNNGGCRFVSVDYFDGNLIYAGGESGFWRSQDGGNTWGQVGNGEMSGSGYFWGDWEGVFDVDADPNHTGWVYASFFGNGKGLYKSTDSGNTWTKLLTDNYMRSVAVSPANSNILYATSSSALESGGYEFDSNGVLFSYDGGANWTNVSGDMDWPFAAVVEVTASGQVYVGSPGTGFQVANVPDVLPVELISGFTAALEHSKIVLKWRTGVEMDNDYFLIEHLDENNHWKKWRKVQAKGNASTYQLFDNNPYEGVNVYRLWQIDFDGQKEMLGVENIFFKKKNKQFKVFPNPASKCISINMGDHVLAKNTVVYVWNTLGEPVVLSGVSYQDNLIQIPVQNIPSGLYYVKIFKGGDYLGVSSFIVK